MSMSLISLRIPVAIGLHLKEKLLGAWIKASPEILRCYDIRIERNCWAMILAQYLPRGPHCQSALMHSEPPTNFRSGGYSRADERRTAVPHGGKDA